MRARERRCVYAADGEGGGFVERWRTQVLHSLLGWKYFPGSFILSRGGIEL